MPDLKTYLHRRKTKFGVLYRLMVVLPDGTIVQPTLGYDLNDAQIESRKREQLDYIRQQKDIAPEPGDDVLFRTIVPLYKLRVSAKGADRSGRNESIIKHHLLDYFGDKRIKELRVGDGDAYVGMRLSAGASKGTVLRECNVLSAIMNYAVDAEYLTKNPFEKISRPAGEERDRVASLDELTAIAKVSTPQLNAAIMLALTTLQREEKIWEIERQHVANYGSGYILNISKPRTPRKSNVRQMPLCRLAMAAINWDAVPNLSGRIFHSWSTPSHMSQEFTKACKRAKVHDLTYHDLRHTGATTLQNLGVDPMTIEKMLGHTLGKVLGRYQHGWLDRYVEAVKLLDDSYASLGVSMGLRVIDVSNMSKASNGPFRN